MRVLRRSRGDSPGLWQCYLWDMEACMFDININRSINIDTPDTLVRAYTSLRENLEFLIRYANRVYRHFFNDGVLTPTRAAAIWETSPRRLIQLLLVYVPYGAISAEQAAPSFATSNGPPSAPVC